MVSQEVSSAEDEKESRFMNVEVDREHYEKLLILSALWKEGTPGPMVEGLVDDLWRQIGEFVPQDLTLEDFRALAAYTEGLEE